MTDEKTRALIAEARTDISDAERWEMLGVTPSVGTLLRMLRNVTNALSALTVPDGDAAIIRAALTLYAEQKDASMKAHLAHGGSLSDAYALREAMQRDHALEMLARSLLSRDIAGEIDAEREAEWVKVADRGQDYRDGLRRAAEIVRSGR